MLKQIYFQVEEAQIFQDLSDVCGLDDIKKVVKVYPDAYLATKGTHAIVVCTEWDEFIVSCIFYKTCSSQYYKS